VVVEIFSDLDPGNPWVRVHFTHPIQAYQWCKKESLTVVQKEEGGRIDPPLSGALSGSGSL